MTELNDVTSVERLKEVAYKDFFTWTCANCTYQSEGVCNHLRINNCNFELPQGVVLKLKRLDGYCQNWVLK